MADGRKIAVLVGNGEYEDDSELQSLSAPANDVAALADLLSNDTTGVFDEVIRVEEKSHSEINDAIGHTFGEAGPKDTILLYYSGHGRPDIDGQLYLCARNTKKGKLLTTALPFELIRRHINHSLCESKVVILDCCYSGAAIEELFRGEALEAELSINKFNPGTVLLTSSTDSQLSWEDTKAGQGLYTHNIIEGIKSGEADIDDDGYIDTEDLGKYTKSTFKGNQTPLYNVKGLSGSLVIAKAGKTSRLVRADRINSIAKGWFLEDELTAKQLELIKRVAKTKRTQLTADQAKTDDLLNRIDAESLSAAQFMVALSEIEGSNTQEQISEGRTSGGSNSEEPPTKAPPSEQINIIEHVRGTTEARRRSNWTPRKTSPFGEEFDSVGALICGE